ncbi:hypothetical protein [Methanobacterium oryzae]|uniref:hypothetical protein n=1 Tax=Methanobacterium oryzae TaxID=69540 RepID=UPI003D197EAE
MAVLDTILIYMSSAFVLALVAIIGYVTLRLGTITFGILMDSVKAANGIENIGEIKTNIEKVDTSEKTEIKKSDFPYIDVIKIFLKNLKKSRKVNAKYAYIQLFKK